MKQGETSLNMFESRLRYSNTFTHVVARNLSNKPHIAYAFAVWLFHSFPKQGVIAGIPLHSISRRAMGCNEGVGWLDCVDRR